MRALTIKIIDSCPQCSKPLLVRKRKVDNEPFVSCSGFPKCRFATDYNAPINEPLKQAEREIAVLKERNARLITKAAKAPKRDGWSAAALVRELLYRFHPDRRAGAITPHELACTLNEMKQRLEDGEGNVNR